MSRSPFRNKQTRKSTATSFTMLLKHVFLGIFTTFILHVEALTSNLTLIRPQLISPNPTNVSTYIYVPTSLQAQPPILVNPHWCHGSAQAAFAGSTYASLADKYGFVVLYPDSPHHEDHCWDVSSNQTLTHNGGGDSQGIISALKWAMKEFKADTSRIFVTGTSSGAMMTNVLLGSYPDIFAAGVAFAGVPFGCFAGNGYDVWSGACATGQIVKTGAEWAKIVQAAYPSYNGFRPKIQIYHGSADTTLYPVNFAEETKQWSAVFGYGAAVSTVNNTPLTNWTKKVYGKKLETFLAGGVTHDIPTQEAEVMKWFDLACSGSKCYSRNNS